MKKIGVIGLGDMGSGIAKNLLKAGYLVSGYDLAPARMAAFGKLGGMETGSVAEAAKDVRALFVMVMNGAQAAEVIAQAAPVMPAGAAIILTATIHAHEARQIWADLQGTGIELIDSPVSGGFPGAQGGTLTLMAAGSDAAMAEFAPELEAISKLIHHVGTEPGMGQTVKACLQTLIGSIFSATYEMSVLAGAAGVSGEVLRAVIGSTGAGNGITDGSLENIINRRFDGTGSGIGTMHKDLTISLDLARKMGVPMHTTATAMQIFQAGMSKYPNGDNQSAARVIEEIVGAELKP